MGQQIDLTYQVQGILPATNGGVGSLAGLTFADNETPSGAVDGSNSTFTLAQTPSPQGSLIFVVGHAFFLQPQDYTLNGKTISCTTPPVSGANIRAWYRYVQTGLVIRFELMQMSDAMSYSMIGKLPLTDSMSLSDAIFYSLRPVLASLGDKMPLMKDNVIVAAPRSQTVSDTMTLADGFASLFV